MRSFALRGKLVNGSGRLLFSGAPARAFTVGMNAQFRNRALHPEMLLVRLPGNRDDRVLGQRQALGLQVFLQPGLGILAERRGIGGRQQRLEQPPQDLLGGLETAVESISFKCTPEKFAELVEIEGIIPAHYVARYHWVSVENLDALPKAELKDLIKNSYKMVWEKLPNKLKNQLNS